MIDKNKRWGKYPTTCESCGIIWMADKPTRRFCSKLCAGNTKNRVTMTCHYCGTEYDVVKSQSTQSKWCSRECYDGYRQAIPQAQPGRKDYGSVLPQLTKDRPANIVSRRPKTTNAATNKPCHNCGEPMPCTSQRRKYCDKCRPIISRKQSADRRRRRGVSPKKSASGMNAIDNGQPCFLCGWHLATCDRHHIIPRKDDGPDNENNIIVLCPNCHRLADFGILSKEYLQEIKRASQ